MMATESETVEAEEEKIEEKQEEEIVVAECNWVKGRSYSVKTFKKVLPPISHKRLPLRANCVSLKSHPPRINTGATTWKPV